MAALSPGTVIAGYRLERLLGRGGMGDVYLARHPRLPRYDALKLMSQELSRNAIYRQRFNSEADLACQVAQSTACAAVHDDNHTTPARRRPKTTDKVDRHVETCAYARIGHNGGIAAS